MNTENRLDNMEIVPISEITPEELERKLQIVTKELPPEEEEENFAFEDADFDLGESKIEL